MASKKYKDVELVNAAGDKRTATSPAQYAQLTFDGYYKPVEESATEQAEAPAAAPKGKAAASGGTASGEKTVGSNPS